jgi:paraquat-inducible protein A
MSAQAELACHHCGAVYRRVPLAPGQWARCVRCNELLESEGLFTPGAWLAVILGALVSLALANAFPVATLVVQGSDQSTTFLHAVLVTWDAGYPEVAILTVLVGFLLPVLHLFLLLWLFVPLSLGRVPLFFETLLTLLDQVRHWCMVPVFLLGCLVAIVKLVQLATLIPGVGLFATVATAILITSLGRLTGHRIRLMAQDLGLAVKPEPLPPTPTPLSISRTWALLIAAIALYFPANLLPVMYISAINGDGGHTIVGGVIELWQMGSWYIAMVVFVASVFVPVFKIALLSTLVYLTQRKSALGLRRRTRLYRLVESIGQWSMLDVFVVILLAALGKFGSLLNIEPRLGAAAFGGVVVLTMLAAMQFDPRLAWRYAGHRRHVANVVVSKDIQS